LKKLKVYSQAKILYVAHDLHFVRELRRAELDKNEKLGKFAVKLKQLELSIAQKSDITLVFSDFEKRVLEAEDPGLNIELMPWIQKVNTSGPSFDNSKDLMFIGSFRHLPNIDGVLWFVNEVFPRIRRHLPQAQLFIVGSDPTPEILALNGDGIVVTGYVKDTSPYFLNCRVFVAPLRYGAGVKGKVIEAASYGLPVVTTQLGAEGLNLKNGKNVLIADDPGGFAQQVVSVYSSRDLWLKLSVGAIDYMKAEHSPDRAMTKFRRLLQPTYV
jgi:glycosyltransferase involved in cell wall biosynthesis